MLYRCFHDKKMFSNALHNFVISKFSLEFKFWALVVLSIRISFFFYKWSPAETFLGGLNRSTASLLVPHPNKAGGLMHQIKNVFIVQRTTNSFEIGLENGTGITTKGEHRNTSFCYLRPVVWGLVLSWSEWCNLVFYNERCCRLTWSAALKVGRCNKKSTCRIHKHHGQHPSCLQSNFDFHRISSPFYHQLMQAPLHVWV